MNIKIIFLVELGWIFVVFEKFILTMNIFCFVFKVDIENNKSEIELYQIQLIQQNMFTFW